MTIKHKFKMEGGWKTVTIFDNDHKRWNQIVGGDRAELEVKGHTNNRTVSVELSERWETESGRCMERTIMMQLDQDTTRALRDVLASVLCE